MTDSNSRDSQSQATSSNETRMQFWLAALVAGTAVLMFFSSIYHAEFLHYASIFENPSSRADLSGQEVEILRLTMQTNFVIHISLTISAVMFTVATVFAFASAAYDRNSEKGKAFYLERLSWEALFVGLIYGGICVGLMAEYFWGQIDPFDWRKNIVTIRYDRPLVARVLSGFLALSLLVIGVRYKFKERAFGRR
jgi:hypothetical protein